MKHYNIKTLLMPKHWTDVWIFKYNASDSPQDFIINATTAKVLSALALGDRVSDVFTEVITGVAGPTATLSVGIVGSLTLFTTNADVAAGTVVPYVSAVAAVTPYPVNTAVNLVANMVISNVAVTAGEVWIWAKISRKTDRNIDV